MTQSNTGGSPTPAQVAVKPDPDAEAKLIYGAMLRAARDVDPDGDYPEWVERGNSVMQTEARQVAARIRSALLPAPSPEEQEPVAHPGPVPAVPEEVAGLMLRYEDCPRTVCGELELPQSESGPCDDPKKYEDAITALDLLLCQTEAERVQHRTARFKAEAEVARLCDENARLREYAKHKRNCAMISAFTDGKECTCGFAALTQPADASNEGEG